MLFRRLTGAPHQVYKYRFVRLRRGRALPTGVSVLHAYMPMAITLSLLWRVWALRATCMLMRDDAQIPSPPVLSPSHVAGPSSPPVPDTRRIFSLGVPVRV
ncbi:hypothetical protein AtNW77_Chr4g0280041 [Arabidopsis thaliana]